MNRISVYAVVVSVLLLVGATGTFAGPDGAAPERQQIVLYLAGTQSTPMQGDTVPGYTGSNNALPLLLANGWKVVLIVLANQTSPTGYAILEKVPAVAKN